ncbi:MAG: EamA family transporter [Bacilli bacterium]|nr:EamA family transporter [Bacilli bacterium]
MNLLSDFKFYIIIYLIVSIVFNQGYKIVTKRMRSAGALTILIQIISSIICIFMIPLFEIKFPLNCKVYIFLFLAIIFYTLNDRLGTTSRSGLEASTYSILKQLSTVFMIIMGILFFKESFVLNKIIGALLIIFSNVLVFYKKENFKFNKFLILGILANISLSIALFLDVNYSKEFNLAFYVLLTFLIPLILIFIFEKIKVKEIIYEYNNSNKIILFLTSIAWTLMMITKLKSYELGSVIVVAPLTSLTVILNIIFSYFLLKERDNLIKKIIAGILIVLGIILIKL